MAKKVKNDNKKEIKKVEEVEEDVLDFEEYDDEDEVVVRPTHNKQKEKVKEEKENDYHKNHSNVSFKEYLPIATFIISIITLILVLAILVKIDDQDGTTKKSTSEGSGPDETETAEYDTSMFTEIDAEKFVDLINNKKEYYFVYTGRPSCSYCQMMIGNYQKSVEEYDYELYYFDTENVTSETIEEIHKLDEVFERDFPSTPMVYLVGKGEVKDVNEGYTEYSTYTSFLEDNGVDRK